MRKPAASHDPTLLDPPDADLPEGWVTAKMLDILDYEGGAQPAKSTFVYAPCDGYVRLLQIRDFGDKPFPTYVPDSNRLKKATADDLLLARYGGTSGSDSLGRICTGLDGAYNVALAKLVFSRDQLEKHYVRYLFLGPWFRDKISQNSRSCQTGFNRNDVKDIEFPLPPLAEQKRIVAKVESLLARVNAARENLSKLPAILKRFRQSVLNAACSGRLTEDWRAENPAPAIECQMISDPPETAEMLEIPEGWRWVAVNDIVPKGGLFDGPFGSNLKSSDYSAHGVRVVRLENVGQLHFIEEKKTYISKEKYVSLAKHEVHSGDIIFASFISDEVRACVLPKLQTKAIAKADCFCVRPEDGFDRKYIVLQLVSQPTYEALIGEIHGATRPRINTTQLKTVSIRICPLSEQHEIVRRVERLFALADTIEKQVAAGTARAEKLTQAILAKAFRGELVPTEAELARQEGRAYEAAAALLDRIRAQQGGKVRDSHRTHKLNA